MRLRQICLVAHELEAQANALCELLGIAVAFRDPAVQRYGLSNVVMPVGNDFLEIVSPNRSGTAAGRYLDRRAGDGGYMVILQGDDAAADRQRLEAMQVRTVEMIDRPNYQASHFHPADTGGILLSIDSIPGGDWRNPDCDWPPAGDHWRAHQSQLPTPALVGAELQSDDPDAFASLWSALLNRPVEPDGSLKLSNATLRFVPVSDGRGKGLRGITIRTASVQAALNKAAVMGLPASQETVQVCGLRVRFIGQSSAD